MRRWLLYAPMWVRVLVAGVPFGTVMGIFIGADRAHWVVGGIGGAVAGAVFGLLMAPMLERQNRPVREALESTPERSWKAAVRAAWRGPVPEDHETRAAAARLVGVQLSQTRRTRRLSLVAFPLFLALEIYQALVSSPWFWAAAAVFA